MTSSSIGISFSGQTSGARRLRILHGTWIPDGFFVFIEENHQPLSAEVWKQGVFSASDSVLFGEVSEQCLRFQMSEWTFKCESKHPQQNPLPTQMGTGILITIRSMFAFLLATGDGRFQQNAILSADDFLYWQRATLFAIELLVRGRVAPTVQVAPSNARGQRNVYSVWVPYLQMETDKHRFQQFENAMPPFCHDGHSG